MSEKYSDQIIDSFLRELVTQQSPPDLSARISAAWERERQQKAQLEGPGAPLIRAQPIAPAKPLVPAKPIRPANLIRPANPIRPNPQQPGASGRSAASLGPTSPSSEHGATTGKICRLPRKRSGNPFGRNVVAALLAVSACGMLAFLGSRIIIKQQNGDPLTAQGDLSSVADNSNATDQPTVPAVASTRAAANGSAGPQPRSVDKVQPLELDNLPFALDASASAVADDNSPQVARGLAAAEPQPKLSETEIVRQIDLSLSQLWNDLQISPAPLLSDQQRAEQVVQLLTGQAFDSSDADRTLSDLVRDSIASPEFAQHWSSKLSRAWFSSSSLPLDDPRVIATEQRIAMLIGSGQPFNRLAVELLGEAMASPEKSGESTTEPLAATSTLVSALAGNGNHRLVARIGTNFLDTNLTCVRCHEANGASSIQPAERQASAIARQEVYWSLVALLQGVDVQGGGGRPRVAVDRQPQQLAAGKPLVAYYDLLDGRLQAAEPRLPSGISWEQIAPTDTVSSSPRKALAQWLSQSSAMDEATVNLVWKIVMGQPLVSQIAWQTVDEREQLATHARRDLQLFLASQYRSHGHDLKQLVSWVVSSHSVGRQAQEISRSQWLDASDAELLQLRLAHWNFAAGPLHSQTSESISLENSLAAVIKWQGQPLGTTSRGETTLAQPAPSLPPTANKRRKVADNQERSTAPPMSYALHDEQPPSADVTFISRLLASRRLSWQQCVEHVVLVNPHNALSGRIKHLADELLRQHSGDAQAALLDLLWAVKNADAI